VLFCYLCSDHGNPNFTDSDWLDILNYIRMCVYNKGDVTCEVAQRTLDTLKPCEFLWDPDGLHLTQDSKDEVMYCVSKKLAIRKNLHVVYFLSSFTTAEKYLRPMKHIRESREKCVTCTDRNMDSLLVNRLQMDILIHVTMKDTSLFDSISQICK
jgi:hypothetical protein